jgi:hypothetical protein
MPYFSTSTRLASLFGFFTAFALGCVVSFGNTTSAGDLECGTPLAHNDANCVCDDGYERCNTVGTDCCEKTAKPGTCDDPNSELVGDECYCKVGYTWCSDDPADLSCCEDPGQTSQSGTGTATDSGTGGTTMEVPTTSEGTTGVPQECANKATPPASCDEASEAFFCTNPEPECTPYDSQYYVCEGGVYVDQTASIDQQCQLDGYDFGYGCVDTPQGVFVECGNGSGDACNGGAASCLDDKVLAQCKWGKQSETDCFVQCTEIGDADMVLYDYGGCGEQDGEVVCQCCDEGDEGCPINEGGSTGGDDTGGSTSNG